MSDPDVTNASAKAVNRAFSKLYVLFLYYLDIIVMAGMTITFYLLTPVYYSLGKPWRDVNDFLYDLHERFVIFCSTTVTGTRLHLSGDFDKVMDRKENILVISNHQVEADYFAMAAAMEKTGSLPRLRHVMKESLVWLPFVGNFLLNHGSFFINRSKLNWNRFEENASRLAQSETPTSVLIYPEGTTWNNGLEVEGVFEKSDALARSCDREPFKHVMFPKHKGFYRLLARFRDRLDAVYDFTIAYSTTLGPEGRKPSPGMIAYLTGEVPDVHIHLRRIDIEDVPVAEADARNFLIERFAEKNELMDAFFETGRFPSPSYQAPGQSLFHSLQSAAVTIAAALLGLTRQGLSFLPMFLGVPLLAGYANVVREIYFA